MKQMLRIKAKSIRNALDSVTASNLIVKQVLNWDKFCNAVNVMIYFPIKNEISLLGLTESSDKNFYLPKINENDEICAVKFDSIGNCKEGKFNIKEPCTEVFAGKETLDLIFLPALCADKWGYRLGYGKGYYDRFLEKLPQRTIKVIPMYQELFVDELPVEPHDCKSDFVILQDRIIETRILLA